MPEEITTFQCPHCGTAIAPATPGESFVNCAACGKQVVLCNEIQPEPGASNDVRAQKIASSRRAAIRVQTYLYVGVVGCVVAAVECVYKARYAGRWDVTRILLVGLATCAGFGVVYFLRHAKKLRKELRKSGLTATTAPPDFSQLGDGSQRVKDLENLSRHL